MQTHLALASIHHPPSSIFIYVQHTFQPSFAVGDKWNTTKLLLRCLLSQCSTIFQPISQRIMSERKWDGLKIVSLSANKTLKFKSQYYFLFFIYFKFLYMSTRTDQKMIEFAILSSFKYRFCTFIYRREKTHMVFRHISYCWQPAKDAEKKFLQQS